VTGRKALGCGVQPALGFLMIVTAERETEQRPAAVLILAANADMRRTEAGLMGVSRWRRIPPDRQWS
jgi:hypothetical protein